MKASEEPNKEALGKSSISLNEICLTFSFAAMAAWVLLVLFSHQGTLGGAGESMIDQYLSLSVMAGLLICFIISAVKPALLDKVITKQIWLVFSALISVTFHILYFLHLDAMASWWALAIVFCVIAGMVAGSFFIFFANELIILATKSTMIIPAVGMICALLIFLLVSSLVAPVSCVAFFALPFITCLSNSFIMRLNGDIGNSSDENKYARLTLVEKFDKTEKVSSTAPLLSFGSILGIREKSIGLCVYGFSTGVASGMLLTLLEVAPDSFGFSTASIFALEAMIVAAILAVSLKVFSVRSYLRLPQWSYYLIAIISFLIIQHPFILTRVIFSGLMVAASIYYFTVDITVLSKMGQDMQIDPKRNFGWFESIFVAASIFGWLLFLGLYLNIGEVFGEVEASFTYLPAIVIAVIAALMSLMRWIYYDSVSKNSSSTQSGEWKRRLDKMGRDYHLSRREIEILGLLVRGRSVNHIKDQFVISSSTVKTHMNNIYHKIGVHSREQLIDIFEQRRNRKSM